MNINTVILNEVSGYLYDYSSQDRSDFSFVEQNLTYEERQAHSTDIIKNIMMANGKQELNKYIADLAKIEKHTKALSSWQRDHVYHAVLTYLIGILLNEKFINTVATRKVSTFQWKLTGLFHDIGYPVQIADNILNHVNDNIIAIDNKIIESKRDEILKRISSKRFFRVKTVDLELLTKDQNSLDLIQKHIQEIWGLDIDSRYEYNLLKTGQRVCHGVISSLLLLHVLDIMYDVWNPERLYENIFGAPPESHNINWNQTNFENEVIPACSAIFLHNLPEDRFNSNKIDPQKATLPFLLKLCDTLQEWQRPQGENYAGHSPLDFNININNEKLIFYAKDPKISKKIMNDLSTTVMMDAIEIVHS